MDKKTTRIGNLRMDAFRLDSVHVLAFLFAVWFFLMVELITRPKVLLGTFVLGFSILLCSSCGVDPAGGQQLHSGEDSIQSAIDALGSSGGIVHLPCGTVSLTRTITIESPIILQGCGTSIGDQTGQDPGTRLIWKGGAGVAIDVGPTSHDLKARGTILRDFNLENQGGGSIGIRINTQEPRMINVFVLSLGDRVGDSNPGTPFTTAGVVVGDIADGQVNDFLCRDCYLRFQEDGIQLLSVSEATIDHSRILENRRNNIVLGDLNHVSNNIQIVNGTNFSSARITKGAGIKVIRAINVVNVENGYCENDEGTLCIDATEVVASDLNQLNIRDNYFAKGFSASSYSVGLKASTANVVLTGNVFLGDTKAGVLNLQAREVFVQANLLLDGTPELLSSLAHVTH
jgi:hypothetical protein